MADTEPIQLKPYYTPAEVARLLGYHPAHVRRILASGKLASAKMPNGSRRISHEAVVAWVQDHGSDMSLILERANYDSASLV